MDNKDGLIEIGNILDAVAETINEKEAYMLGHSVLIMWKMGREIKAGEFNPFTFDQEYISTAEVALCALKKGMRELHEEGEL